MKRLFKIIGLFALLMTLLELIFIFNLEIVFGLDIDVTFKGVIFVVCLLISGATIIGLIENKQI